jgi:hypothetical protein
MKVEKTEQNKNSMMGIVPLNDRNEGKKRMTTLRRK